MEEGNYETFTKLHDISNEAFTYLTKKEKSDEVKVKVTKDNSNKVNKKEKEKLEREIENLMNKLDELNEQLLDENIALDWVRYRTIAHECKETEEKIELLMLKLEDFN